jgi:hypothetical protein
MSAWFCSARAWRSLATASTAGSARYLDSADLARILTACADSNRSRWSTLRLSLTVRNGRRGQRLISRHVISLRALPYASPAAPMCGQVRCFLFSSMQPNFPAWCGTSFAPMLADWQVARADATNARAGPKQKKVVPECVVMRVRGPRFGGLEKRKGCCVVKHTAVSAST